MGRLSARIWVGILLVIGGALFLLQNLGIIPQGAELFWAVVFGLAAIVFLVAFLATAGNWWAAIPGFALLGLAALLAYEALRPAGAGGLGGAIFLGGISLAFWAVLLRAPAHWWAAIPAGVMATLAVVTGLDTAGLAEWSGSAFFYGLGLTFVLLTLIPSVPGRTRWPLFPAVVLLAIGLTISLPGQRFLEIAWPVILIGFGLYLLIRRRRPASVVPSGSAQAPPPSPAKPEGQGKAGE